MKYEAEDDWLLIKPGQFLDSSGEEKRELGHLLIMGDENLVTSVGQGTFRITADGHNYLSAIRSETIWNKTKSAVAETGGSATIEIIKKLAFGFLKQKVEKHTGIEM